MKDKHIVVGVTGSIAAYKAADLVSKLKQAGAEVCVVMTKNAEELIGPATFRAISGNPVLTKMFTPLDGKGRLLGFPESGEVLPHIRFSEWMDIIVIAPATANIIGKITCGIADDLLSTMVIASKKPVVIAPAMNEGMYKSRVVQENIIKLKDRGFVIIEPEEGFLACGYQGKGRLAKIETIMDFIQKAL